jgi:two-component system, NarL family, sensor histidine kinase DesK
MTPSDTSSTPPTQPAPLRRERGQGRFWRVFPLVWLGYLYFPVKSFLGHPHTALETLLSSLGLLVFVGVWLAVYLLRLGQSSGTQPRLLLAGFAACVLLYVAGLGVIGYGSATFLVYAAALIGFQGSLTLAGSGLLLIAAALLTPGWLGFARLGVANLVQILILSCVAMYGNHAGYRQNVASMRLARVQAEKEKLAADAERERIARDLHDLLGHTLSVIVLKSELAGKLAERDPVRAAQEIREVERISREALVEVRAAVSGYRGSGLSAELARSKVALATSGVRLDLDAEALSLPPGVEYAMEMVLREAVTNIVRHARARAVTVRISQSGAQYVLEVQDDGTGPGGAAEGTGLTSMRERVRAAGGQFALSGTTGLTVRASFPLRPDAPALSARAATA